jgi:hypothetical protein
MIRVIIDCPCGIRLADTYVREVYAGLEVYADCPACGEIQRMTLVRTARSR